ncbi:NADP-dependent malic enzyme [Amycolatopsis sp. cmx-4-83]|uniref:NAD(P)-dependent malic enzyme n=1 Tax=Amycolatopsis sp. cmx-4-83 TaxID=2790940 RepID=UPI00397A83C2
MATRVALDTPADLAEHYPPGVADQAKRVAGDPAVLGRETVKANSVAIVSDGSALLGLGDATSFGAINLEDIAAPRCFTVERRLHDELDIPVFHDDQHGTAVVVLGALHNALKLTGRDPAGTSVVISGACAAGSAIARLLLRAGYPAHGIVVCDRGGVLHENRDLMGEKGWLAANTNAGGTTGTLQDALRGADVFVGVSAGGTLAPADVAAMAGRAIVFALANPDPAAAGRHAGIVPTGRSDFPNQITNVLAFPGMFRGLLDSGAPRVTAHMLLAAARALADVVGEDLAPGWIVPSVFDEGLVPAMAEAVAGAAKAADQSTVD